MSTHNIPLSYKKENHSKLYPKSATIGFCSKGLKNQLETAMVNKPSVFEPLKFYCSFFLNLLLLFRNGTTKKDTQEGDMKHLS